GDLQLTAVIGGLGVDLIVLHASPAGVLELDVTVTIQDVLAVAVMVGAVDLLLVAGRRVLRQTVILVRITLVGRYGKLGVLVGVPAVTRHIAVGVGNAVRQVLLIREVR